MLSISLTVRKNAFQYFWVIVLVLCGVIAVFPFVYMFLISLTQAESLVLRMQNVRLDLSNYSQILNITNFWRNILNSLIVSLFACIFNGLFSSLAAFGFEKRRFRGSEGLFMVYLATLMIPGQVTLIPVFVIMRTLGMINTYAALILPFINAFGVFLIRQFMVTLPDELLEAACMDGANERYIFTRIVLPLSKPVLISLTIFTFITAWNDFIWPLVITTTSQMRTLVLALSVLRSSYSSNYGLIMAGAMLTFLFPFILYSLLQKQFVEGIAISGIKI